MKESEVSNQFIWNVCIETTLSQYRIETTQSVMHAFKMFV